MSEADTIPAKSEADSFADWEGWAFGFGYGTGEDAILPALKSFFSAFNDDRSYDHQKLEAAVGPAVTWLLINVLCRVDAIEYGTSPRSGWLTPHGERLKAFVDKHTAEELVVLVAEADRASSCSPDFCNCGPRGYVEGRKCPNPFWSDRR